MVSKIEIQQELSAMISFLKMKWVLTDEYVIFIQNMVEKAKEHFKHTLNAFDFDLDENIFPEYVSTLALLINKQKVNHFICFQNFFQNYDGQFGSYSEVKPKQWDELLKEQNNNVSEYRLLEIYEYKDLKSDKKSFKGHDIISDRRSFCLNVSAQNIIFDCIGQEGEDLLPSKWLFFYVMEHIAYCIFKNNAYKAIKDIIP